MKKPVKSNYLEITVLIALFVLLTACGGGGGGGGGGGDTGEPSDSQNKSNPDFIAKAQAVNFSRIRLYKGRIKATDREATAELNTSRLRSGDLITIDVEFEVTGDFEEYSLSVQLVPQNIFSLLDSGDTIGDVINGNSNVQQGEGLIDLGGVYIDEVQPGILHGMIYAKLPVLAKDMIYKVAVTPMLQYLSADKEINESDIKVVPIFIDDRKLAINKLDRVSVKIIDTPDLTIDNDFTQLEIGGKFDKNGYSIEPVFQTSVKVDVTGFNKSEDVILSLSWAHPSGKFFPLGLLSTDVDGSPIISTKARFTIERTGVTPVTIPVVAYVPVDTQEALLNQATNIKDVADQDVQTGKFKLEVFYAENGDDISTGNTYNLSIPLVSQDNKLQLMAVADVVGFTALRAGSTNSACLGFIPDIDTGLMPVDGSAKMLVFQCNAFPNARWRYDFSTRQIISEVKDANGDNYCITAIDTPVIGGLGGRGGSIVHVKLQKCIQPDPFRPVFGSSTQKFEFVKEASGYKIKSSKGGYLDVNFSNQKHIEVVSDIQVVTTFFTDTNGVEVDQKGRIFYVGKFYNRSWGNADEAQVRLNYGGELYVDYMPVIGATTRGNATLSASLFGASTNLLDTRFALKRYLPKKTSIVGNNYPDVKNVGNGAELLIDVTGFAAIQLGGITKKTITETYDPLSLSGDVLDGMTDFDDIEAKPVEYKIDEKFLETTVMVWFIPVTIKGGVEGPVNIKMELTTPGIGLDVNVKESMKLSVFLSAGINAYLSSAGLKGEIEVIEQTLTFAANGGFNSAPSLTAISFDIGSSLQAELKLLRGKMDIFLKYPKFCICAQGMKMIEKTWNIYESAYLFNKDWEVYSGSSSSTVIDF